MPSVNYMNENKINVKKLVLIIIPIFIELVLQLLAGNVDKLMVKKEYLATSINQANSILDLIVVSLSVLSASSLILISQYKGSLNKEKENGVYVLSFYFNLFIGIILSLLFLTLSKPILYAINVGDLFSHAYLYLMINGGFVFLQGMMLSLQSFLRSNEYMKTSLLISIIFNVINIILNAILLYLTDLNPILAVALSSVISRFIGVVLLLFIVIFKLKIKLSIKLLFPLNVKELKKIISIALPSTGEAISYSLSQIVIIAFINLIVEMGKKEGIIELSVAQDAKTYASMIALITYLFVNAASQGMQIMLGRYLGANDTNMANKLVMKMMYISIIVSTITALLFAITSNFYFSLMIENKDVIALCEKIMYIEIALEFGRAINIVLVRALQTAGDVMFPTILAVIFCWAVATVGSYVLGYVFKLGLIGVWISMAADEVMRAAIFVVRWKKGKWKEMRLAV